MVKIGLMNYIMYSLYDKYTGHNILPYYKRCMINQWSGDEDAEEEWFQDMKLYLGYANDHVPYYRRLFKQHNIDLSKITKKEDLLKIPYLTKEDINKNRESMVSDMADKNNLIRSQSGGSTGEPISFYVDNQTLDAHKAIGMRFYDMMELKIGAKAVRIWGNPRTINTMTSFKARIIERMNNRLFLNGFDLSEETMSGYVKKIKQFNPELIFGYVQCIDLLAKYIQKHGIKGIHPKAVVTTTSVLYPEIRERLETVFGCKVFNEYGSCEIGAVAHECDEHDGMHIDTELCYIEFINSEGKHAEEGEQAEIVVTTLCNEAMPLIRYKIGDIGSYSTKKCKCGRRSIMLNDVTGRTFGVFTTTTGGKVHGYYFTNRVFMQMPNVKQFQMIQDTVTDYRIRIVKNPGYNHEDVEFITTMLKDKLGAEICLKFEYPDKIDPEGSGKYLYTKSNIKEGY